MLLERTNLELVVLAALCLIFPVKGVDTFDLFFTSPQTSSSLQVDSQGRSYVITGNQLLRLSTDVQLEQNVTLSDRAGTISLSPDGLRLLVCLNGMSNVSCFVYNTSDLTAPPVSTGVAIIGSGTASVVSFSAEGSFYVGSYQQQFRLGIMRLSQYIYGDGTVTAMVRTKDYTAFTSRFQRAMLFGFANEEFAYFVVVDPGTNLGFRILRLCHNTSCPGNEAECGITALYEQAIQCGNRVAGDGRDTICGATLVQNFNGVSGSSLILSRCREGRDDDNSVCSFNLADINANMDTRYDDCIASVGDISTAWSGDDIDCRPNLFRSRCDFDRPLDDIAVSQAVPSLRVVVVNTIITIGPTGNNVTASLAIQVDGLSIVVTAYTDMNMNHFVAFFNAAEGSGLNLGNTIKEDSLSSSIGTLEWQSGLSHIYGTSSSSVIRVALEECSVHRNCSSCVSDRNPLCGWCVVENKCSRVSQCANGNSTSDRWICANTTSSSGRCITFVITPTQYVMDDLEILSVSVTGPGLPVLLPGETYSCLLADSQGRYSITVPAVSMNDNRNYTCNITNANFNYVGIASVIDFSFVSSQGMVPFDTTANSLTIFRCSSASSCNNCLQTDNACGWCSVNKICRGVPTDCINSASSTTFLQVMRTQTFGDVCPLLLTTNDGYSQHVRVDTDLQLTTSNLPPIETEFSYMCDIGGTTLPATRSSDTSITCGVAMNQLSVPSVNNEVVNLAVIWTNRASITHRIDVLSPVNVTLYDCIFSDTGCSACVNTRMGTNFQCGWCDITSTCRVVEECSMSIITEGNRCPVHTITNFSPQSGPPGGGTIFTITGTNLGVTFSDFSAANSITLMMESTSVPCTPISDGYVSGATVRCRTGQLAPGTYSLVVRLTRNSVSVPITASARFVVSTPTVSGASPLFGPIAGGTLLTITGTHLDIGNNAVVRLGGISDSCVERFKNATVITCSTSTTPQASSNNDIVVTIDDESITPDNPIQFSFRNNPRFISLQPQRTILGGGIILTFSGTNLDVALNPQMIIDGVASKCRSSNSSILICITPATQVIKSMVNYMLILDNAPSPNATTLPLAAVPDPTIAGFVPESIPLSTLENGSIVFSFTGRNLLSVLSEEIRIDVGRSLCRIQLIDDTMISCMLSSIPKYDDKLESVVKVFIGTNIQIILSRNLKLIGLMGSTTNITGVISIAAAVITVIIVICFILIIFIFCIKLKKKSRNKYHFSGIYKKNEKNEPDFSVRYDKEESAKNWMKLIPQDLVIMEDEITFLNTVLGEGHFGIVQKAKLKKSKSTEAVVAVKTVKGSISSTQIEGLFSEILKMNQLSHPHLMNLVGVCVNSNSYPLIVMPYMGKGSLLDYLKKERNHLYLSYDSSENDILVARKLLLTMCHQISLGMSYLSTNHIVHRDLAARNCLLDGEGNIKVSDFGLSEDIYCADYFRQKKNETITLPFKWMAPESLRDTIFSVKSDVWSYGVTCWEIFSCGKTPYPGVNTKDLSGLLDEGVRLDYPTNAANTTEIYIIIQKCWKLSPEDRPTFDQLFSLMEAKLQAIPRYVGESKQGYIDVTCKEDIDAVYESMENIGEDCSKEESITMMQNEVYNFNDSNVTSNVYATINN